MKIRTQREPGDVRDRRTLLITAAAIAAVVLAGGTAVAANIGVLGAAGDDSIGQLTAAGEIASTTGASTSAATTSTAATTAGTPDAQGFQVEDAGVVTVRRAGSAIELVDVAANAGWTWSATTASPAELAVTFTSPTTIYVFTAQAGTDGAVSARVDRLTVQESPENAQPAPAPSAASIGDDDPGSEHHDDADEYEEHEGGEDDD